MASKYPTITFELHPEDGNIYCMVDWPNESDPEKRQNLALNMGRMLFLLRSGKLDRTLRETVRSRGQVDGRLGEAMLAVRQELLKQAGLLNQKRPMISPLSVFQMPQE